MFIVEGNGYINGCFEALLPQICDAVKIPVIATGGIADARQVAAALLLGASAVQIGTGLLRCPEDRNFSKRKKQIRNKK